eukprot:scaffold2943_cov94-Isochrysis_galbana.AAC.2
MRPTLSDKYYGQPPWLPGPLVVPGIAAPLSPAPPPAALRIRWRLVLGRHARPRDRGQRGLRRAELRAGGQGERMRGLPEPVTLRLGRWPAGGPRAGAHRAPLGQGAPQGARPVGQGRRGKVDHVGAAGLRAGRARAPGRPARRRHLRPIHPADAGPTRPVSAPLGVRVVARVRAAGVRRRGRGGGRRGAGRHVGRVHDPLRRRRPHLARPAQERADQAVPVGRRLGRARLSIDRHAAGHERRAHLAGTAAGQDARPGRRRCRRLHTAGGCDARRSQGVVFLRKDQVARVGRGGEHGRAGGEADRSDAQGCRRQGRHERSRRHDT